MDLVENFLQLSYEEKEQQLHHWLSQGLLLSIGYSQAIQLAEALSSAGYVDFALVLLFHLYEEEPQGELAVKLALNFESLHEYEEASSWLKQAEEGDWGLEGELLAVRLLLLEEEYSSARKQLLQLVQTYPTDVRAYLMLSDVYMLQGDITQAIYYLEIVRTYFLEPEIQLDTLRQIIELSFMQEHIELEPLEPLVSELEKNADKASDWELIARYYRYAGDTHKQEESLLQAHHLNKDEIGYAISLLELYKEMEDEERQDAFVLYLLKQYPHYQAEMLQLLSYSTRQTRHLISSYMQRNLLMIADMEELYQAAQYILETFIEEEAPKEALDFIERYFSGDEDLFAYSLAQIYEQLDREEANYYYERAIEQAPKAPLLWEDYVNYKLKIKDNHALSQLSLDHIPTYYQTATLKHLLEAYERSQ